MSDICSYIVHCCNHLLFMYSHLFVILFNHGLYLRFRKRSSIRTYFRTFIIILEVINFKLSNLEEAKWVFNLFQESFNLFFFLNIFDKSFIPFAEIFREVLVFRVDPLKHKSDPSRVGTPIFILEIKPGIMLHLISQFIQTYNALTFKVITSKGIFIHYYYFKIISAMVDVKGK